MFGTRRIGVRRSGGRGIHTETFSHYEEMPRERDAKITAEHEKPTDEE